MKLAVALVGVSVAVMFVLLFQAVRQELSLRELKTRMVANSASVKTKEASIVELKTKTQEIKAKLADVNTKIQALNIKKAASEKSAQDLDNVLQTCNKEKTDVLGKKTEKGAALTKLKADHEAAKQEAEEDIKNLKQKILDRDAAICSFADTTKEEARKLCGISEAQK